MNNFNNIQSLWSNQEPQKQNKNVDYIKAEAKKRMQSSGRRLGWGIIILSITAAILGIIICYLPSLKWPFGPGLLAMFLSVTLRSSLEIISMIWKQRLNIALPTQQYKCQILRYYRARKALTTTVTFSTLALYVAGFSIMIPAFYSYMQTLYFIGVLVFILVSVPVFSIFLIKKSKEELKELNEIIALLD